MTRLESVEVRLPSWRWRAVCTAFVLVLSWLVITVYSSVQGPFEAHTAVAQLQDDEATTAIAHYWATSNLQSIVRSATFVSLALLWGSYGIALWRYVAARQEQE